MSDQPTLFDGLDDHDDDRAHDEPAVDDRPGRRDELDHELVVELDDDDGDSDSDGDPTLPPDEDARERIRHDLAATLFVEAGAGAGKTTALVDRVVNLVLSGVDITGIAAITFTEKAAAELRIRVRERLAGLDHASARTALDRLDHAPIGTLHAFARRILDEVPIEAGLPPGFSVLDELESNLRFDDEWSELLDRLLAEAEPAGGSVEGGRDFVELCRFEGFGLTGGLRSVATGFRYNWDLVAERVDRSDPGPIDLEAPLRAISAEAASIAATDVPPDDKQAELVATIGELGRALQPSSSLATRLAVLPELRHVIGKPLGKGAKQKWKALGIEALNALRERELALAEAVDDAMQSIRAHRKRLVGAICGRFVLEAADARVRDGVLDFHDLLVHSRRLLATRPEVRRELHQRYERVMLDEFQDTDPIQLEIAVRLTADPDDPAQNGDWRELTPLPGRLFIVGDPKQSIYRFRRADIAQYLRAADQVGADTELLSANFRSTDAVIDFTNELFDRVIVEEPDAQPAFQRLDAARRPDLRGHGSVHLLGAQVHADLADGSWSGETGAADELRRREARDVAGAVTRALREGWPIVDEVETDDGTEKVVRPCRPGDICILLPARLSLAALETELRASRIPYRAENASVVYATGEVRSLLLALRAADDPTDELAVVASLRSTLYGCSDVELWEWRRDGGTWGIWREAPDGLTDHPVAAALRHLRSVNERISTTRPADLMAAIADECRVFDVALAGADDRDVWRRLRFVIDQARAWSDAGGRGVRRYLDWAYLQASEGRVSDTILPELDHDAVRLMTVHASKGLEFPITIVSGLTTKPQRRRGVQVVWEGDDWHLTGRGDDGSFDDVAPIDELMSDAERRRLLYVACTRAVDHLVVSLHRQLDDDKVADKAIGSLTSAELLWRCGAVDTAATCADFDPEPVEHPRTIVEPLTVPDRDTWSAELERVTETASRRGAIAATRLADEVRALRERDLTDDAGLDKAPVNIDLPPWQRGRYGTSIGRAVHGTLQFCDLATGDDIDDLARSQCAAEGIIGLDRRVASLARSALSAPIVRSVVEGAEHWRELFLAAPVGSRILEGYIDLLVRTPEGLVIVDYKTDRWSGPVQTVERIGRYRTQLASYGAALEATLDETVVGGVLVRCEVDAPAEQIEIERWREAVEEVRQLVR